eukprot:TRINITY_DN1941_c0_g1_i1.p1 TRINITY_DN1941_c0_g1~~TRINITY_DN1941_c0_g1_i1.p1  ORF type:complete len:875 (-),score=278.11 TRINITY_DN1941_c0_g1_i1:97-2541(-)
MPLVANLTNLCEISLPGNGIEDFFGDCVFPCENLRNLDLASNRLTSLPSEMCDAPFLEEIYVGNNLIKELPVQIGRLKNLKKFDVSCNDIVRLPVGMTRLKSLRFANFSNNCLRLRTKHTINLMSGLPDIQTIILSNNPFTPDPTVDIDDDDGDNTVDPWVEDPVRTCGLQAEMLAEENKFEDAMKAYKEMASLAAKRSGISLESLRREFASTIQTQEGSSMPSTARTQGSAGTINNNTDNNNNENNNENDTNNDDADTNSLRIEKKDLLIAKRTSDEVKNNNSDNDNNGSLSDGNNSEEEQEDEEIESKDNETIINHEEHSSKGNDNKENTDELLEQSEQDHKQQQQQQAKKSKHKKKKSQLDIAARELKKLAKKDDDVLLRAWASGQLLGSGARDPGSFEALQLGEQLINECVAMRCSQPPKGLSLPNQLIWREEQNLTGLQLLQSAQQLGVDSAILWYLKGMIHLDTLDLGSAQEDFERALARQPELYSASVGIILALFHNGSYQLAADKVTEQLKARKMNDTLFGQKSIIKSGISGSVTNASQEDVKTNFTGSDSSFDDESESDSDSENEETDTKEKPSDDVSKTGTISTPDAPDADIPKLNINVREGDTNDNSTNDKDSKEDGDGSSLTASPVNSARKQSVAGSARRRSVFESASKRQSVVLLNALANATRVSEPTDISDRVADYMEKSQSTLSSFNTGMPDLLILRSRCWMKLTKIEYAIEDLSHLLTISPLSDEAHFLRGSAYRKSGDPQLALNDMTQVLSIQEAKREKGQSIDLEVRMGALTMRSSMRQAMRLERRARRDFELANK